MPPLDIDAALLGHAKVKESVSFAVPHDKYGEEAHAAMIWKDGSDVHSAQTGFVLDAVIF